MLRMGGVLVFLLPLCGCIGREPGPTAADEAPPIVRSAECRWAATEIMIDGYINELAWSRAQPLTDFAVYWQKRKAKTATRARLLWNRDYFFFSAEMEDSDLYATIETRNGPTWENDVFEIFLKPSVDKLPYYEFQVTPINTQLELFFPSRGAGGHQRFAPLSQLGMESAVRVKGTINNWEDKDTGWTVEGRIPWTAFAATGGKPKPGEKWRFALCRYDYSKAFDRPELSSTAPLTESDFHRYEDYGELIFKGPPN